MKICTKWILLIGAGSIGLGRVDAQLYDFNQASQLGTDVYTSSSSFVWNHETTGGIHDSGWLETSTSNASSFRHSVMTSSTFSGATQNFELGIYFKWVGTATTSGDLLVLGVGQVSDNSETFEAKFGSNGSQVTLVPYQQFYAGIAGTSTNDHTVRFTSSFMVDGYNTNSSPSTPNAELVAGNWYYLGQEWELNEDGDGFEMSMSLHNASGDGTIGSLLIDTSRTGVNAKLVDGQLHAFFMGRSSPYSGVSGVDNFVASAIPEAGVGVMLLLGLGLGLGTAGRRRNKI